MRRVIVSEFVTLDGVMEDPGGAEGFERGGWAFQFERGPEGDKFKLDEVMEADAMLLGRVTYQGFADKMNGMAKYVVSNTLESADWNNSTVIRGDVAAEIAALKQGPGGDMLVAGSGRLVDTLRRHGLVDEYRLMVFPVVLGSGKKLFGEGGQDATPLRLVETLTAGEVVILRLEPASGPTA
jgi:dihydrofolate reductase